MSVEGGLAAIADLRELCEVVREGAPLRIAGAGTWLDAGRPVDAERVVDLAGWRGIVAYTPGDLTLTARAGTTLGEIATATAAEGQWLALDPHGSDAGTIGATVACAACGPLSHAYGRPRDLVLGVEVVTGTGAVVRGGGQVVKNVAGFDLTRLHTGAWGTLGVITEVTVRLHARPEVDTTVAIPLEATGDAVRAALERLAAAPIAPIALEVVNAALARRLGLDTPAGAVLVRLAGTARSVVAQRERVADGLAVPTDTWRALRAADANSPVVYRLSDLPTQLGALWDIVNRPGGMVHATPGRGVVRAIAMSGDGLPAFNASGTLIGERLPAAAWTALASRVTPEQRVRDRLGRDLRAVFDPGRVLNPGICGT